MKTNMRQIIILVLLGGIMMMNSGCLIKFMSGNVFIDEELGEVRNVTLNSSACLSNCVTEGILDEETGDGTSTVECTYLFPGFFQPLTVTQISEFGILGVFIDPIVIQMPQDIFNIQGSFNDGTVDQPLVITSGLSSFKVQPGVIMDAEPGQQIVIVEFPASVPPTLPTGNPALGAPFDFTLDFQGPLTGFPIDPIDIKAMFTGKVEVNGETCYPPMFPFPKNFKFADIPTITIPVSDNPVDLLPGIQDLVTMNGDLTPPPGFVYDFRLTGPVPEIINDSLNLDNVNASYDPGDARAPAGVFTIDATFTNTSSDSFFDVFFDVSTLTDGNEVLNADGGPGGVGSRVSAPNTAFGPDGILAPGESFTQTFEIGLQVARPFSFFVDAFGTPN